MAKYVFPELSFHEALRQLEIAHQLELLHAKSDGRWPYSFGMLIATGEGARANRIDEGLDKLVEFTGELSIRHVQHAVRQLPRSPPNPSDILDIECLDAGKFPETPRSSSLQKATVGTSDTVLLRKAGNSSSTERSQSADVFAFGLQSVDSEDNLQHTQKLMTALDPFERWVSLMEVVFSKHDALSEVHRVWLTSRPQDLGQVFGVSTSADAKSKELLERRQRIGSQMPTAMAHVSTAPADALSTVLSGFSGLTGAVMQAGWAVHPNSKRRLFWDLVGLVVCLYDLITFPMQMVRLIRDVAGIAFFFTMYWTLDIFMSCISGYFTKDGLIELRATQVLKKYMRTWMILDVGLCVFDWLSSFVEMTDTGAIRLVKSCLRFVRIVRVLRLLKLMPKLKAEFGQINSDYISTWLRLVLYICSVVMMNHYIACLFCSVWSQLDNPNKQYRYVSALHWALSHCLLGSMDITPDTVGERILSCVVLVISMVVFASLLSNITKDTANLQALSVEKKKNESVVRKFFHENSLPPELVGRVWHVIQRNNLASGGRLKEDTVKIFNLLPQYLQKEIRYETFRPLLVNHPFFEFYNVIEPNAVRMLCSSGINQMRLLPYEQLDWPSGAGVDMMLFVAKGELCYYPNDLPDLKLLCPVRRWALEQTLWAKQAHLDGPLTSGSAPCELMFIVPSEFHDIARIHHGTMHLLRVYAVEFVRKFNEACSTFEDTELLFNSDAVVNEILEEVRDQCHRREALLPSVHRHFFFHAGVASEHHVSGFVHDRKRKSIGSHLFGP